MYTASTFICSLSSADDRQEQQPRAEPTATSAKGREITQYVCPAYPVCVMAEFQVFLITYWRFFFYKNYPPLFLFFPIMQINNFPLFYKP